MTGALAGAGGDSESLSDEDSLLKLNDARPPNVDVTDAAAGARCSPPCDVITEVSSSTGLALCVDVGA